MQENHIQNQKKEAESDLSFFFFCSFAADKVALIACLYEV